MYVYIYIYMYMCIMNCIKLGVSQCLDMCVLAVTVSTKTMSVARKHLSVYTECQHLVRNKLLSQPYVV